MTYNKFRTTLSKWRVVFNLHFEQLKQRSLKERALTLRHPELWIVSERDERVSRVDVVVDASVVRSVPLCQRPVQTLRHVVRHAAICRVANEQNLRPSESTRHYNNSINSYKHKLHTRISVSLRP